MGQEETQEEGLGPVCICTQTSIYNHKYILTVLRIDTNNDLISGHIMLMLIMAIFLILAIMATMK